MTKIIYLSARYILAVAAILMIALTACSNSSSPSSSQPANEVWMQNNQFVPNSKTVAKGTTLSFVNKDQVQHTVTSGTPGSPDGTFDNSVAAGQSVSITFNTTGTIHYFCRIHQPMMTGVIIVQ